MPPGLTLKYSTFRPHSEFECFVRTSVETAIISKKNSMKQTCKKSDTNTMTAYKPFKDEEQTALFKDPVRTAQ